MKYFKNTTFLFCQFSAHAITFTSVTSGDWKDASTWNAAAVLDGARSTQGVDYPGPDDDAIIATGTTVRLAGKGNDREHAVKNLTIQSDAVVDAQTNKIALSIFGSLVSDGSLIGNKENLTFHGGVGTSIDGEGDVKFVVPANSGEGYFEILANTTIASTANITFNCIVELASDVVITNNGTISVLYDLLGGNSSTEWVNTSSSRLNTGANLLSTGVLTASAVGNTVNYTNLDQDVKTPVSNEYYNLEFSYISTKTQQSDLTVLGDFTIINGTYDCANYQISLKGDFINEGGFFIQGTGKFIFNGIIEQSIDVYTEAIFYDLEINGGGVSIENNSLVASNILSMIDGDIQTNTNKITLGTSTANPGTFNHTSGGIDGYFERFITLSSTTYTFPLGIGSYYHPADISFNSITTQGSIIGHFSQEFPDDNGLSLVDGSETVYNTFYDGYWEFTAANSFVSSDFDLDLDGNGFNGFTITSETRILTRSDAASVWLADGTHVSADVGNEVAKRTNVSTISGHYCFGDNTNCIRPILPVIISTDVDVCTGTTGNYSVTDNSPSTYNWSIDPSSSGTITATDHTASIVWGTIGAEVALTCYEENTCTRSEEATLDILVNSIAPTELVGKEKVAVSSTETYSVANRTDYAYQWVIVGGTQISGGTTNSISVDWDSTEGDGSVSVTAEKTGCDPAQVLSLSTEIYDVIESNGTGGGDWLTTSTWDCDCVPSSTDNILINPLDVVTHTTNNTDLTMKHLTIETGGELQMNKLNNDVIITGNFELDGSIYLSESGTNLVFSSTSTSTVIDGFGIIIIEDDGQVQIDKNRTISPTSILTISNTATGEVVLGAGVTITNQGTIQFIAPVSGGNAWVNDDNSILELHEVFTPVLTASASGNVVVFEGDGDQDIIIPTGNAYYEVITAGTGSKKALGTFDLGGSMAIMGDSQLDLNGFDISVAIDWVDTSGHASSFVEGTSTVTLNGVVEQYLYAPREGGETFYNLIVNNTLGGILVDTNTNVSISNLLTLTSGIVDLRTYGDTLIFLAGSSVDETSNLSYVKGKTQKIGNTAFEFPVGENSEYAPISMSAPAVVTDAFLAEYFNSSPVGEGYDTTALSGTLDHVSNAEYWLLNRTEGSSSVSPTLSWDTRSGGVTLLADLVVSRWDGTQWADHGNVSTIGSTSSGTITGDLVTDFSPFTLASISTENPLTSSPLPIKLAFFKAEVNDSQVELSWSTLSELNNDYFTIERSHYGDFWEAVTQIDGAIDSKQIIPYTAVDESPYEGLSYYRLKQTDLNGEVSYSSIVLVDIDNPDSKEAQFMIFPNPTDGSKVTLVFDGFGDEEVLVEVRDLIGNVVFSMRENGLHNLVFESSNLVRGTYFVQVSSRQKQVVRKLIKK
jgi:hypothetical protein